jgi:hypothetical protein
MSKPSKSALSKVAMGEFRAADERSPLRSHSESGPGDLVFLRRLRPAEARHQ